MPRHDDETYRARAIISGAILDNEAISGIEPTRARRALACLKSQIGNRLRAGQPGHVPAAEEKVILRADDFRFYVYAVAKARDETPFVAP